MKRLLYLHEGKMFYAKGDGSEYELPSETLRRYIRTTRELAKSKEWKTKGAGAQFMGQEHTDSPEEAVSAIQSRIHAVRYLGGDIYYSMTVDQNSGIYRKDKHNLSDEGIVLSEASGRFEEFDISPDERYLVYTECFASEKHLGLLDLTDGSTRTLTEGAAVNSHPAFDPTDPNRILFSSAGLSQRTTESGASVSGGILGPRAILALDLADQSLTTLLEDENCDYLLPTVDGKGNLLCIKRPYRPERNRDSGGCLLDTLLFLPRPIWSLIQFLSFFSRSFSGKSLTASTDVKSKQRSESELFIEGNRIKADEEAKRNAKKGEDTPGIIPSDWELIRIADKEVTVLKKGVCAYLADEDGFYYSDGASIRYQDGDGKAQRYLKATAVTGMTLAQS